MKKRITMKLVQIAILSAISTILYTPMFSFPLPFLFPGFLEIQFSNLPAIIGGFAISPIGGCAVIIIKTLLKLLMVGTSTAYVGELADIIIGVIIVLVTSLIYKHNKTKKNALISLIIGSIVWVICAILANWLVLVPFYIEFFMGGNIEVFIGACSIIPGINESNYMIMYLMLGAGIFNLVLASLTSIITFFIYKRISILFDKME